jgi:hypothetical protein
MLTRVPRMNQPSSAFSEAVVRLTSRIQAVRKKKICKEVEECLGERSDLSNGKPDLLESDGCIAGAFGNRRARALLLE